MAHHRAATPGGPDIGFGSAELATALLERLGALAQGPAGPTRRHAASVAGDSLLVRLTHPAPVARPALAALSATAVGAAAALAATGGMPAVTQTAAALSLSSGVLPAVADAPAPAQALAVAPAPAAAPAGAAAKAGDHATAQHAGDLPVLQVKDMVDKVTAAGKELTDRAKAAAPAHVSNPAPTPPSAQKAAPKASGVAGVALAAAMSAIGRPYSWGATGPSAFDCSGLVQWAFAKAGVKLPRTAAAQSQVGTPVSRDELQPGDLVFFYSPVSHVGIYVGGGKVVNATQSGEPVQLSNIANMPVHNMRRL